MSRTAALTTAAFLIIAPAFTFLLLVVRGLPGFALPHVFDVFLWTYQVTWIPALLAGLFSAAVLIAFRSRLNFFLKPYDVGRCLSFGAITGALAEAAATGLYRHFSHRPFSGFWIAGAMIAGCLSGALIFTVLLWRLSFSRYKSN